jgi:hypothetical protein
MTSIITGEESQRTSISWQVSQFYLRGKEWWELKIDLPQAPEFPWLTEELWEFISGAIFWILLLLLLIAIFRLILPYLEGFKKLVPQSSIVNNKNDYLSISQWVERSQRYVEQQNYHEACLCLYQGMLQLLDEYKLISQQQSRTDGEYWRLIEGFAQPQPYQTLLLTHQSLCFGNIKASLKTWENCDQAYQQISLYLIKKDD